MAPVVWGLDLGTTTGLAVRQGAGVRHTAALRLPSDDRKFAELQRALHEAPLGANRMRWNPQFVYYEDLVFAKFVMQIRTWAGLYAAMVMEFGQWQDVPTLVGVSPTALKKHATGRGNAKKPEMLAAAREKWPTVVIETHDVADALWLADYGIKEVGEIGSEP